MPLAGTTLQGSEVILERPPGLTPSELPVTANRPLSVWKAVDVCDRRPGSANTCTQVSELRSVSRQIPPLSGRCTFVDQS